MTKKFRTTNQFINDGKGILQEQQKKFQKYCKKGKSVHSSIFKKINKREIDKFSQIKKDRRDRHQDERKTNSNGRINLQYFADQGTILAPEKDLAPVENQQETQQDNTQQEKNNIGQEKLHQSNQIPTNGKCKFCCSKLYFKTLQQCF